MGMINNEQTGSEIANYLQKIEQKIDRQAKRMSEMENAIYKLQGNTSGAMPVHNAEEPDIPKEVQSVPPNTKAPAVHADSLEQSIAGNWFAKIGIVAVVIGIGFFLKYAFDNDWIDESARIIIGLLIGSGLFILGAWMVNKYYLYGQIISGGGLGILYLSLFASYNFYHLISYPIAFLALSIVTIVAMSFSVLKNTPTLFVLTAAMGFLTPMILWSDQNNLIGLFSYILLLDLAIVAISLFKKEPIWSQLNWFGFFATEFVYLTWQSAYWSQDQLIPVMFFLTLFFLLFSLSVIIATYIKKDNDDASSASLSVIVAAAFFFHVSYLINQYESRGFLALWLAAYYSLLAILAYLLLPKFEKLLSALIAIALSFAVLFIPMYFHNESIAYCWLIEAALLSFFAFKFKNVTFKLASAVVVFLSLIRLFYDISQMGEQLPMLFNPRMGLFVFATITMYICSIFHTLAKRSATDQNIFDYFKGMQIIAVSLASFFTVYAISIEIMSYFESIASGSDKGSIVMSIWWLLYGIAILMIGFAGKFKKLRLGGLFLLSLAIFKLFIIDLWNLGQLYRIISSMVLGIVLLLVSFGYQRYRHDKINMNEKN